MAPVTGRGGALLVAAVAGAAWVQGIRAEGSFLTETAIERGPIPRRAGGALAQPRAVTPRAGLTVDPAQREAARVFYNVVYGDSSGLNSGWGGDLSVCDAGSTGAEFREQVALRLNYFRAMAGLPADITLDPALNAKAQQAALMMTANLSLNHYPPPDWECFTAEGAEAAGNANLALGKYGPDAISGYMDDPGANNVNVGHRRWFLYPQTRVMGTGDIPPHSTNYAANATWVIDGQFGGPRPSTRHDFVSWPPPGYVPYPLVYYRWSLGYPFADFSQASVTLVSNGVPVNVTLESPRDGAGDNTLVWHPTGLKTAEPSNWPKPAADTPFDVTVRNVRVDGVPRDFSYRVTVFDPQVSGPDTVVPVLSGPAQPAVNQPNAYTFTPVPVATGYQWRWSRPVAFTATLDADQGLGWLTPETSGGYEVLAPLPWPPGAKAFHLAHTAQADQRLTGTKAFLPGPNAQLKFRSMLGWSSADQIAQVQVSVDEGRLWQEIYAQAGGVEPPESTLTLRTVSLSAFAGRSVRVRFNYHVRGPYYPQSDYGVGWYVDDVAFTDTEELTSSTVAEVASGTGFSFSPPTVADYALAVRAEVYDRAYLEWSPIKKVKASNVLLPTLAFLGRPTVQGHQVQLNFQVVNYRAGLVLRLLRAPSPAGPWVADPAAGLETVTAGSTFRFVTSANGSGTTFFWLQAD